MVYQVFFKVAQLNTVCRSFLPDQTLFNKIYGIFQQILNRNIFK